MKKILPFVIVAAVVILSTASTVSATVSLEVTPSKHVTCPQTSSYWGVNPSSNLHNELVDKTVTYVVYVETDAPPVTLIIKPGDIPLSWFSSSTWYPTMIQKLNSPNEVGIFPLNLKVPLTLGKDASGVYTFTIHAVDSSKGTMQQGVELEVQDHDFVSETMMQEGTDVTFTLDERYRNMAIAMSVDQDIHLNNANIGYLEENVYEIVNARGNNANFQQESIVVGVTGHLSGNKKFKSCAPLGGTGATFSESYLVHWMGLRYESFGQYVTGEQRYKTELSTYNQFNGSFRLDASQIVPTSRHRREYQEVKTGNVTYGRHIIYRLP